MSATLSLFDRSQPGRNPFRIPRVRSLRASQASIGAGFPLPAGADHSLSYAFGCRQAIRMRVSWPGTRVAPSHPRAPATLLARSFRDRATGVAGMMQPSPPRFLAGAA
jgi:hypothetical protein